MSFDPYPTLFTGITLASKVPSLVPIPPFFGDSLESLSVPLNERDLPKPTLQVALTLTLGEEHCSLQLI